MPQTREQRNQKQRERRANQKQEKIKADTFFIVHMERQKSRLIENIEILKDGIENADEQHEELKKNLLSLRAQEFINKHNSLKWKDAMRERKEAETDQGIKKINIKLEHLDTHKKEMIEKLIYNNKLLNELNEQLK